MAPYLMYEVRSTKSHATLGRDASRIRPSLRSAPWRPLNEQAFGAKSRRSSQPGQDGANAGQEETSLLGDLIIPTP